MLFIYTLALFIPFAYAIPTLVYDGNHCPDIACNINQYLTKINQKAVILTRQRPLDGQAIGPRQTTYTYDSNGKAIKQTVCSTQAAIKAAQANRNKACNGKDIKSVCQGEALQLGIDVECDEFPFATTYEGGEDAEVRCVPAWQNNLGGGGFLSGFYSNYKLQDRHEFQVTVVNLPNCRPHDIMLLRPTETQSFCATYSDMAIIT